MRKAPLEWPLLLGLLIPLSALRLVLAVAVLQQQSHAWLQHDRIELILAARDALQRPKNWASENALQESLKPLPWQDAWLQDQQGAHIWHQSRHTNASRYINRILTPRPPVLQIPLSPELTLHLRPKGLSATQMRLWQRHLSVVLSLSLLLAALGSGALYWLISYAWRGTWRWAQRLESGELDAEQNQPSFLPGSGLSRAHAASLAVLAKRLRFARSSQRQQLELNEKQQSSQIAELKDQLNELRQQHDQTQALLDSRAQEMSRMGHELRTPLTAIVGFSDLLQRSPLNAEQQDHVATVKKSAHGLVCLINDLLDLQRADAGQLDIHQRHLDIASIIEDVLTLLAPQAYEKGLELISIVDHDVPSGLQGDPERVRQILINLVSNAIKFTNQGQVIVRATRRQNAKQDDLIHLNLQVEDSGSGLSAAQIERLFTAFQRFESNDSPLIAGSGLGLSIVKKLSTLLGGSISVDSTPGQGSCFRVSLPMKIAAQASNKATWDALRGTPVWVMESHDGYCNSLLHQLEYWGLECQRLSSLGALQRALANLSPNEQPELIILGMQAKALDLNLIAALCERIEQSNIRLLGLINSVDSEVQQQLERAGVANLLTKVSHRGSLYRRICAVLNDDERGDDSAPAGALPLAGKNVLVAENNPASQHVLNSMLQALGAQVHLVENGAEAVAAWALSAKRQQQPRFVLLDLNMPVLDGEQTARQIRQQDSGGASVIIGMSAYLDTQQRQQWQQAGADCLLEKPFDNNQLVRALQPWLRPTGSQREPVRLETTSKPAIKLVQDPELAAMMREELPKQMQELDQAFIVGDWRAARDAAHQLHGTAAFFHLEPLKSHLFLLETRLNKQDTPQQTTQLRDDMANVSNAVQQILQSLQTNSDRK